MGLLEDAIREHLELKRLRGADPAEVAREQHEVLDTPASADAALAAAGEAAATVPEHEAAAPALQESVAAGEDPGDPATTAGAGAVHAGGETAELDMEAVLAEHPLPTADTDSPPEPPELAPGADEDSLEWEVPARSHDADPVGSSFDEQAAESAPATEQAPHTGHGQELEDEHVRAEEQTPGQGRLSF